MPIRIGARDEEQYVTFMYAPLLVDGVTDRVVAAGMMVTEQVRARSAIEAANSQLEEANALKDEFIGLVSHELRTPLTTIRGNADILRRQPNLNSDVRDEVLADIVASGERLNDMIENLLLIARAERGEIDSEPLMVARVIGRVLERHRRQFPQRAYEMREHDEPKPVEFSVACLEQITENLLSNAEKYSPPNTSVVVEVRRLPTRYRYAFWIRGRAFLTGNRTGSSIPSTAPHRRECAPRVSVLA
jgi:signal transduction histidine kinase